MMSQPGIAPVQSGHPWYRHVWPWLLLTLLSVCVVAIAAIDPLARYVTHRRLARLHDYRAEFCEVHVSLSLDGPSYEISGLRILRKNPRTLAEKTEPVLFIDRLEAFPVVEDLATRNYIGVARVSGVKARVPMTAEMIRQAGATLNTSLSRLDMLLRRLLPIHIDRIEVHDAALSIIDGRDRARPPLLLSQIEATVENFTRLHAAPRAPTTIAAHLRTPHSGDLSIFFIADTHAQVPIFAGQVEVQDLQLTELYDFLIPRREIKPLPGTLDLLISFKSTRGTVTGTVKPVVTNVERDAQQEELAAQLRSDLHDARFEIFPDPSAVPAPAPFGPPEIIPISAQLQSPEAEVWPAVMGVVGNAVGEGVFSGVSTASTKTRAPKSLAKK